MNLKSEIIARMDLIRKEKADLMKERELLLSSAASGEDYARLAAIRSRDIQVSDELTQLEKEGIPELTIENLARVIELWTKIPASSIREDEYKRLNELDKRLKAHIIGQDEAVDTVCAAIRRNRVGVSAKHKPVSFIFIGSTGVGKTAACQTPCRGSVDSPEALIRLDMSELWKNIRSHASSARLLLCRL